ncbi:uncharacterized protein B0H18DRAFT_566662 [Fomitopsis serialis]|uniref:uncharacterized protein n=1 Tax=Fomitopsis serialis TaxID=139415 RepID=UPI002008BA0C|nr:uncharacterized protein B0H18DRAFT_566662 [Neoantrodia serialis]KAH9921328.1 hypothetical protein B0H18DRAFT_566662 [Neoantrodia serialis]
MLTLSQSDYTADVVISCASALFHLTNGAFTALRAYAISNHSVLVASAGFLLSLVLVTAEIHEIPTIVGATVPDPIGCVLSSDSTIWKPLLVAGQACTVVAEALLVIATWRHIYTAKSANDARIDTPITSVLLRDGTLYFIAILAALILDTTLTVIMGVGIILMHLSRFADTDVSD